MSSPALVLAYQTTKPSAAANPSIEALSRGPSTHLPSPDASAGRCMLPKGHPFVYPLLMLQHPTRVLGALGAPGEPPMAGIRALSTVCCPVAIAKTVFAYHSTESCKDRLVARSVSHTTALYLFFTIAAAAVINAPPRCPGQTGQPRRKCPAWYWGGGAGGPEGSIWTQTQQ